MAIPFRLLIISLIAGLLGSVAAQAGAPPSARTGHVMVYDPVGKRILLFGGHDGTQYLDDTWEWRGTWKKLLDHSGPGPLRDTMIAYEKSSGDIILYGIANDNSNFGSTWIWNGSLWECKDSSSPKLLMTAMADSPSGLFLYSGLDYTSDDLMSHDGYSWSGDSWNSTGVADNIGARGGHKMVYDPIRRKTLLWGGGNDLPWFTSGDGTWLWDGSIWTMANVTTAPGQRTEHAMAFDVTHSNIVVYGGLIFDSSFNSVYYGDTWIWDGRAWTQASQTGPGERVDHAMACDEERGQVIMFGGVDDNGNVLGDTWAWDGTSWQSLQYPWVTSITPADPSPSEMSTLHFIVTFSEDVTGVDASDFVVDAPGITGASVQSVSGSGSVYTVTVITGRGHGQLGLNLVDDDSIKNAAGTPLDNAGLGTGNFSGDQYTINRFPPAVTSITRNGSNLVESQTVEFMVKFSKPVTGVTTKSFAVVTSSSLVRASVLNVTGSGADYTVAVDIGEGEGDIHLKVVDDDTIKDQVDLPLGGVGLGNGDYLSEEFFSVTPPAIQTFTANDPSPTCADLLHYTIVFSQVVNGVDAADFTLTSDSLGGAMIQDVNGTGTTRTITVHNGTNSGKIQLRVINNGSIVNTLGMTLRDAGTLSPIYVIDRTPPRVVSITPTDPLATNGGTVHYAVHFSKPVSGVSGGDFFAISDGTLKNATVTDVSGSGADYTVSMSTGSGSGRLLLKLVDNDSIQDAAGLALGGAGTVNGDFISSLGYNVGPTCKTVLMTPNLGRAFAASGELFAYAADVAPDGNYFFAGGIAGQGAGKRDAYLAKVDAQGNKVWEKTFGGTGEDFARAMQVSADGSCLLVGTTYSTTAGDANISVIKVDAQGNKKVDRTFGGTGQDCGYAVCQTLNGGYIVAGSNGSTANKGEDAWLIRLDKDGKVIWSKAQGKTGDECALAVACAQDGGFVLAGRSDSDSAGKDSVYLVKVNASGDAVWSKTITATGNCRAKAICPAQDGGFIVAGATDAPDSKHRNGLLIKVDAQGQVKWQKTFGGACDDCLQGVIETAEGLIYAVGASQVSKDSGTYVGLIVRVNKNGLQPASDTVGWALSGSGALDSELCSVRLLAPHRIMLAGSLEPYGSTPGARQGFLLDLCALPSSRQVLDCLLGKWSPASAQAGKLDLNADGTLNSADLVLMVNSENSKQ